VCGDLVDAEVDCGFHETSAVGLRKQLTPLIRTTQPCTRRIAHEGIMGQARLMFEIEYGDMRRVCIANSGRLHP
jgi:bifunctional non-homologous end joining protein LigD